MADVKEITYTKVPLLRDDIPEPMETIWEMIRRGVVEAKKRNIEANAIIINKNMVHVPTDYMHFPDMICGLDVHYTSTELPDNYSFAILHSPNARSERLQAFESIGMEPGELQKAAELYKTIKYHLGGEN